MLLVLLGAALHASWNAVIKSGHDKFMDMVLVATGSAAIATAVLPFLPLPSPASWPYAVASVAIHVVYFAFAAAYRVGDMSFAYPLMRGTAPLIVAASSSAVLGEHLSAGALAGELLICGGVLGLTLSGHGRRGSAAAPAAFALGNAVVIALYTLVDGVGARLSGHAAAYTLWVMLLTAVSLLSWAGLRRPRDLQAQLAGRWHLGVVGGACSLASYALALWAMTKAPIASVAALRETSILFAMAFAMLVLKERFGWERHAAAAAVALGAVALRLA